MQRLRGTPSLLQSRIALHKRLELLLTCTITKIALAVTQAILRCNADKVTQNSVRHKLLCK